MRTIVSASAMLLLAGVGTAEAQQYYQTNPCAPAPTYSSPLANLVNVLGQAQRDKACAAFRQAQWADYNAKQAALRQQAKAEQDAQAEADRQQKVAQARADAAAENERAAAVKTVAAMKVRQAALQRQRAADQTEAAQRADEARRQRYIALVAAEQAPENVCRDPKVAREVLDGWNSLDNMKDAGLKVIDIDHLTTTAAEHSPSGGSYRATASS